MAVRTARRNTSPEFHRLVYRLVRKIPRGKVATYGQVAAILGHPRAARAVGLTSVSFAKLSGGGARVNWTPMGGGSTPVIKYNVWRRVAGSMAPFSKIGETTALLFDDTTPGKFEYEITPGR